jgi:hypothetical protein
MPFDQVNFVLPAAETDAVLAKLVVTRAWLSDPTRWSKGHLFCDEQGNRAEFRFDVCEGAVPSSMRSACAWGALIVNGGHDDAKEGALDLLTRLSGRLCVGLYNDHPDTTHADILALYDRAIAARRGDLS